MSLETALADLTKAVAENNALLSGLTAKANASVSSKTDEPVKGEGIDI